MSALALPPQPSRRLRMVTPLSAQSAASAHSADTPGQEALPARAAGAPRRPLLRLVTEADAPARPAVAAPAELRRRPSAPRSAKSSARGAQKRAADRPSQAVPARRAARPEAAKETESVVGATRAESAPRAERVVPRGALASLPAPMRRGLVSMAVVVLLALVAAVGIIASGLIAPVETSTATVQAGQSLWDIAAATGASDVSEAMAQIVDLNDLDSSTIHPGQTLVVPVH